MDLRHPAASSGTPDATPSASKNLRVAASAPLRSPATGGLLQRHPSACNQVTESSLRAATSSAPTDSDIVAFNHLKESPDAASSFPFYACKRVLDASLRASQGPSTASNFSNAVRRSQVTSTDSLQPRRTAQTAPRTTCRRLYLHLSIIIQLTLLRPLKSDEYLVKNCIQLPTSIV